MVIFNLQKTLLYFPSCRAKSKLPVGVNKFIYLLLCLVPFYIFQGDA